NQFADLNALESEKAKVISIFNDVKAGIKELNSLGIKISGATGIKELNQATKDYQRIASQLSESQKLLAQQEQQLQGIRDKLSISTNQIAKDQAIYRQQLQENNSQLKIQATLENAVTGSIEEAVAQIKNLVAQRNILNLSTEAGKTKQKE